MRSQGSQASQASRRTKAPSANHREQLLGAMDADDLAGMGGLHRATAGTSTKQQGTALIDWFNLEAETMSKQRETQPF